MHEAVKKWTSKVNLFELDYIIVPINKDSHWSLVVMVRPGRVRGVDPNTPLFIKRKGRQKSPKKEKLTSASTFLELADIPANPTLDLVIDEDDVATSFQPLTQDSLLSVTDVDANQIQDICSVASAVAVGVSPEDAGSDVTLSVDDEKLDAKSDVITDNMDDVVGSLETEIRQIENYACVLCLDSQHTHNTRTLSQNLRKYLNAEWVAKMNPTHAATALNESALSVCGGTEGNAADYDATSNNMPTVSCKVRRMV
jgi:Ulp1 family protease